MWGRAARLTRGTSTATAVSAAISVAVVRRTAHVRRSAGPAPSSGAADRDPSLRVVIGARAPVTTRSTQPAHSLLRSSPMPILTAAVVLVGILCVIDLLLTFGIIRRLREQNETLRQVQQQPAV